jgi:hypothetical protein
MKGGEKNEEENACLDVGLCFRSLAAQPVIGSGEAED